MATKITIRLPQVAIRVETDYAFKTPKELSGFTQVIEDQVTKIQDALSASLATPKCLS